MWSKIFVIILCLFLFSPLLILSQEEDNFAKARWLFQHQNYEEALPILEKLRVTNPQSSEIAFYLGLTYKRLQDYKNAQPHLESAITLIPPIKAAYIELIDLLYQCDKFNEAKDYIVRAEKEGITGAGILLFKGLLLMKEGKLDDALKAFSEAEKLDPAISQTVKYYQGLLHLQANRFKEAKTIFREIILKDPTADLALFSEQYLVTVERKEETLKLFRGNVVYAIQYDDNVVTQPNDKELSKEIAQEYDLKHTFTTQGEFNFKLKEKFGLKTGYSFYITKHNEVGFYDIVNFNFPIQPGIYFKKLAVTFPVSYSYTDLNDKKYFDSFSLSNLDNFSISTNQLLQLQLQYNLKRYHWSTSSSQDNKDSREYLVSLGWFYFFGKNYEAVASLRYAFDYNDAWGLNWKSRGNRLSFSLVLPLSKKLKWNFIADYHFQDYLKRHSSYDKFRKDNIITVLNLLSYEILKDVEFQLQHTFVDDIATVGAYKYKRNIYGLGIKYSF
ncbi:MAG: tetratricopeptide repeat protein [Candidatus Omnitrophica bacterium]|nr:tetratricopeptide repeat protein [Candidatus Omnitrophota bacterium]MCM8831599.1 tetratricopeptide repeat protein [Candidatus Omnitrophota bacterium]